MNRIFKVIWSKTRNCYVVASELAKGRTKAASTGDKAKRLALAAITALMLLPVGGYSYAEDITTVKDTSDTVQTFYTKNGVDAQLTEYAKEKTVQTNTEAIATNTKNVAALQTAVEAKANAADVYSKTEADTKFATNDQLQKDVAATNLEVAKKADKATTLAGYGITDAYTKAEADANLQKAIDEEARIRKYSVTKLENADQQLQTKIDNEAAARETADSALDSRTSALEAKTGSLNRVAAANSTSINESMTLKDKQYSATLQVNGSGAQIGVVNNSVAGLANDGGTAYTEYRARTGAILSKATNDISSTSSNGQVVDTAGDTTGEYSQAATAKSTGTTFTYSNDGGKTSSSTTIKGNSVSTGTVSATAGITDETTKDGTSVIASQTVGQNLNALDERITNVKEYLKKQTSDTYVSKDDAAVQDGAIVKADKTIGENVTNLDAALAKETADRLGADKAQDKVIQQVNQNMVDGFNTINKNMADGFTALNNADLKEAQERAAADTVLDDKITAETSARVAADTKLVEAVNSGLSLGDDNVLQKNTTTIDDQGNVTTSKTDAKEMILNKGKDNQITLNENGIKVGTNSSVMDANGVYTGGDTYSEAKAAMSADGKIKGANGAFTVDENGNVTSKATITGETVTDGKGASMSNGTVTGKTLTDGIATITNGNINTSGSITGGTVTSTGNISALGDIHAGGAITGASASIQGALTAGSATITGDLTAGGAIQGKSISDGTATMQNGNLTGVKNLSAETITTSGDATIGGDLTVKGKLNVDEIDLTKNGLVGDNNVTASTKVAAGEITSYKKATSTKDGSEKESAIDYDENGTSTWAKATDADDNWNKSTLTVEGNDVTSKVIDSEKNSNLSTQTSTQSQSTLKDKDSNTNTATQSATESSSVLQDKEGKTSTFQQRVDEILNQINSSDTVFSKVDQKVDNITSEVKNGDNATSTTQSATDITNTAKQGTITNEAQKLVNKASDTISNEAANNITNTSTNGNIANTATNGTISNNAKELTNTASENITNKAENGNISNIASNGTISNEAKTISNKADEALTNDAKTITNTASESVTTQIGDGSTVQSVMNESGIANKATGKSITNDAATITNTGTTSVTNQVGNNKVLVDTTHVQSAFGDTIYTTWDESGITNNATDKTVTTNAKDILNTATGDITNSATNGTITNTAKDLVNTASENMTNNVGKDLTTTVGGKQTTTVTGDSSLTAENITNEAKNKITNKAIDVETDATSSIVQKVTNDAGSNTSTQLSYQTTEEMSQADGKTAFYLRGAAEEKSQLIDGANKTTIDTIAGQTNTNITDGTNTSNDLQKADQIASSVTDGTNTTVVNQDAKSLASSITDGTKANNTNNTVDKSEQLIKASDTQYSSSSKTATKMEDALVSGSSVIDVIKSLDDAANPFISSAVTDGSNSTGVTQTAKDITNTAKNGTIANEAKDITNNATENMTNTVGKDLTTTVGGEMKTTVTGDVTEDYKANLSTTVGGTETHYVAGSQTNTVSGDRTVNVKGTETENFNAQVTNVKTDQETSVGGNQTNIVGGDQQNTVSGSKTETVKGSVTEKYGSQATTVDGDQSTHVGGSQSNVVTGNQTNTISGSKTETVKGAVSETYGSQTTKVNGDQSTTVTGKQTNSITGDQVNTIGGSQTTTVTGDSSLSAKSITNKASEKITSQIGNDGKVKSEMTSDGITNTAEGGTIYNKSKDILNEASGDILNFADGEIGNVATKITNITGDNTVTSDTNGTTFENKAHNTAIKEGTVTKTTISGNTIETGQAKMDYAEVMKDLGVHGNATVDQKLTVKGDSNLQGNANVGKNLTVNGTSDLKGNVTMESNATVQKDLTVNGTTTTNKLVVNNGATIKGGTTTDTLHVTSTSTFDGAATFKDVVTMEKDLSVGGNATVAGSMTASSYKVGDKTYISESGINANNQKVVNVAAGDLSANSMDAVNGAQLYQTNERVTGVENKVNKLDSRVDKVGANAAALANLHPLEFDADSKWNIAAAVGGYKGETATAIGAFYRPNENVMVNVSSSFGTGENMYGGGISLRIGQGGNKARRNATNGLTEREKAMQKQIDSLTSRLDALLSVINPNMSKDFPDVPENHWAYEAVSRLAGNGVIQGYEDGKYHGDRTMTRYEMAEIIYNALSKGAKAEKKLVEEFKPELQAMAAQKKA